MLKRGNVAGYQDIVVTVFVIMANAWPNPVLEELRDEELLLHSECVEAGGLLDKFASWGWSHPGLTKAVAFLKRVQQIRRAQRHKQQGQQEQQPERHQQAQQPELPEPDFMMELTEIAHEHDRPQFGVGALMTRFETVE